MICSFENIILIFSVAMTYIPESQNDYDRGKESIKENEEPLITSTFKSANAFIIISEPDSFIIYPNLVIKKFLKSFNWSSNGFTR